MDEEKEKQEIQEKTKGEAEETSTESLFDKTEKIVAMQKAENDRRENLIKREEELFARKQLGGQSSAGQTPEKPKEETPEEYAKRVMANDI